MDKKFKFIVSASSALLNTLLASPLFATNLAPDINPGFNNPPLMGANYLPNSMPGFNKSPLQAADLQKRAWKWTPKIKEALVSITKKHMEDAKKAA
jgi:hypothetical protein